MEDHYRILGVSHDATQDQIKKSYRRLAKEYHPDKNAGNKRAEEKFKKISEAYSVLSDEQKRAEYDNPQHTFSNIGGGRNPFSGFGGFGDIFSDFFGDSFSQNNAQAHWRSNQRPPKNPDLHLKLQLSFMDCIKGEEKAILYKRSRLCTVCDGHGHNIDQNVGICKYCEGHGKQTQRHGTMVVQTTCRMCGGSGMESPLACFGCHGQGTTDEEASRNVKIPKGIKPGQRIKIAQSGHMVNFRSPAGDLYLEIIAPDSEGEFTRKDNDIFSDVKIPFTTATLGGEIQVSTINGRGTLRIPRSCQPGSTLMIQGAGVETHRGKKGNHYVNIDIAIPRTLNQEQEQALKNLRDIL